MYSYTNNIIIINTVVIVCKMQGKCGLACAGIQAMVKAISDTQYFVHQLNLANYKYSGTSQITYDKKHTKAVVQVLCDQGFVYSQSKNLCLPCPPGRYSSEGYIL